jgi:deoxyribose-phosphate aldolase
MRSLRIAIGADHGGFETKQGLIPHLKSLGHSVQDVGTHSKEPVDYPRIASQVATAVSRGNADFGIIIDGAGIGSAMTANKFPNVLAAACYNEALARNCREHNGANVLTLGAGQTNLTESKHIVDVFLATECTAERHLARVKLIKDYEKNNMSASSMPSDLSPDDVKRIADRVKSLISGGGSSSGGGAPIPPEKLCKLIDHTILKAEASQADVEKLCKEAIQHGFFSVCVNPTWVKLARTLLRGSPVKVCAVVGFPLGAVTPQTKSLETRRALRDGAQEIDMVINIGALKSKDDKLVLQDIRGVVEDCKDARALSKVIFENSLLTDEEKVRACELSMKAGADYVKTSTGMSSGGATAEDIALMARITAPKKLGVKASGGVRTYADVVKMVNAGATRVGCSSSVKIMEEARALAGK